IIHPVGGLRRKKSVYVGLHGVAYISKVAGLLAVAVNYRGFSFFEGLHKQGDNGGIGSVGTLLGAEYIEIAQAYGFRAIALGKYAGIQLVYVFGYGIGRQGISYVFFHFGECGAVAVGSTGRGIDHAFYRRRFFLGDKHV